MYRICDAGDYSGVKVEYHVEYDLNMKPSLTDPSLYINISDGKLEGVMGIYVDGNLNDGNVSFKNMTAERLSRFDSKPRVYGEFEFFCSNIATTGSSPFPLSQSLYANKLNFIPKEFNYTQSRCHLPMLP